MLNNFTLFAFFVAARQKLKNYSYAALDPTEAKQLTTNKATNNNNNDTAKYIVAALG